MSSPLLDISVQPTDGSELFYLPIAAKAVGEPAYAKIVLRLRLRNSGRSNLTLSSIRFTYPGTTLPPSDMQGEEIALDPQGDGNPQDGVIRVGTTATWSNGVVDLDTSEAGENKVRNEVYLPLPAPATVAIEVRCTGYSAPKIVTMNLVPYTDPTGFGALRLPFASSDLGSGNYMVTSARHWANGGANGTQIYAHDVDIQGRVNGDWTRVKPGTDGSANGSASGPGSPAPRSHRRTSRRHCASHAG